MKTKLGDQQPQKQNNQTNATRRPIKRSTTTTGRATKNTPKTRTTISTHPTKRQLNLSSNKNPRPRPTKAPEENTNKHNTQGKQPDLSPAKQIERSNPQPHRPPPKLNQHAANKKPNPTQSQKTAKLTKQKPQYQIMDGTVNLIYLV